MGFSNDSFSNSNFKHRNHFQIEHRPRMLKDFLLDDSYLSFPKKPTDDSTIATLISKDLNKGKLLKTRSTSAFQAMVNAVKNFHFTAVKSPSILPKSLSRKLSKKSSRESPQNKLESEIKITVTIKDIIRWKSFRDLIEEKSPPLYLAFSPNHCTTTTVTGSTATTTTTPCSSNGSSWCDSDFTSEYLPFWNGNSEECCDDEYELGKKNLPCVGEDSMEATKEKKTKTKVGPKVEEKQQNSPVSVIDIDIEFEEDEEYSSLCFDQSLATMQRKKQKIMQKIQRFEKLARIEPVNLEKWMSMEENISSGEYEEETKTNTNNEEEEEEEEAQKLLNHVKEMSSLRDCKDINLERLLLDFFREELGRKRYQSENYGIECEILSRVKSWLCGENREWIGWDKREACIRDMDREGKWKKFEEEQEGVGMEIENEMTGLLLDELLLDIISY